MKSFFLLLLACITFGAAAADSVTVFSPDRKIAVTVRWKDSLTYEVRYREAPLLLPSTIDLELQNGTRLSGELRVRSNRISEVRDSILSPVPEKRRLIPDHYLQLTLQFRRPFTLELRVYNDGLAYRIGTRFRDSLVVQDEVARFRFPGGKKAWIPLITPRQDADRFHTAFEELYPLKQLDSLQSSDLAYSPVLVGTGSEVKVAITESGLEDYPGMFLGGTGADELQGVFAPYPLEERMTTGEFPQLLVASRADYIARIGGTRTLPWRVLLIAEDDRQLPVNDLVYRLAPPSRVKDVSWIRPGQGTDEWITGINLFNVPFKSGINTATYKFYIDFAHRFGLERIMMDAGWSSYTDLFRLNPALDMDSIAAYARGKGVKLSMWTLCSTLDRQLDSALAQFNRWGVDFIMTDFMDRDDQKMVGFYHRIAKACADRQIMVMFHGAYPPKGLNRTYPNVMNAEGVLGSEYNIWSSKPDPEHDLVIPFTRMLAGPLDYEPGLLNNVTREQFRSIGGQVMSQGTRAHQLAMFLVYDAPVPFFSGNPSQGLAEPHFMELLGSVPTTWDETRVLEGRVGDHIITARRKGSDWFIAGMTDWQARAFDLHLDFLEGAVYRATRCVDGINAATYPADYRIENFPYRKGDPLRVEMAPGGGFLLRLAAQN